MDRWIDTSIVTCSSVQHAATYDKPYGMRRTPSADDPMHLLIKSPYEHAVVTAKGLAGRVHAMPCRAAWLKSLSYPTRSV